MTSSTVNLWKMYEGLKYNFLFNNDINSIHILLTLYDLEENITNICPKYMCIKHIKKKIKYLLKYRKDRDLVANNVSILIHEDIDRLELCFYLEGYKFGFYNNKWANTLEEKAISCCGIENIYKNKYLFHYDFKRDEIKDIKDKFNKEIDKIEKKDKYIEDLIYTFCESIIKSKINNLNDYIDKQLKIDFNPHMLNIEEEGYRFTKKELDRMYQAIIKVILKNINKIYKDASWFGLNDKVLKRYS